MDDDPLKVLLVFGLATFGIAGLLLLFSWAGVL